MTEFARAFRLHPRHGAPPLPGAEFPDGSVVIIEDLEFGTLAGAASLDDLVRGGYQGARVEWAPTTGCPNPAAHIEVRDPCPHCADHQLVPRRQMAEHQARMHSAPEPGQ